MKTNKRLKIVFVCIYSYPSICGVWSRVYNLSKMLIKKGHEVHVFSTNIVKEISEKSSENEVCEKIKIHRFNPSLSFGENIKFWNFYKKLKDLNPDIIIAEVYRHPHTNLALRAAKKLQIPVFLTTHAPFVERELRTNFGNLLVNFYDRFYGKRIINKFDKIITITKWELDYLYKLGADKDKIEYIPNGIPEDFFKLKTKKGKGLLFLGRISPIKNLETLILAFSKLSKKYPDLDLKIVGPAEENYKNKLIGLIKKLRLDDNIKFFPVVHDLKKEIKIMDNSAIFVLPSFREAMPQTLIEVMARGKIVIASNNKGSSEIIEDNTTGFLFKISDADELAEKIEFCLNNKNEKKLNLIRRNAVEKVKAFKWDKLFNDFYKLILNSVK